MLRSMRLRSCMAIAVLSLATGVSDRVVAQSAATVPPAAEVQKTEAAPRRPRIGLVLSGGGARGAAHIGVLKVLEEYRVPVHFIAGTSMGSIVGASYASGMSVPEMEKAIAQITTEKLFTDNPPRRDEPIRIKNYDYLPLAAPEFGFSLLRGFELPIGIVSGVALEGELRKLVKLGGFRQFDRLPIPYRAISTNLASGQMVVFERGELPTAMRASMAVPGLVAPLNVDGQLLVDGGLVRNLPVDVARGMGADVIIAVNLGTPLMKPEEIRSLLSVSFQMINLLTEQNVNRSLSELRDIDVLIVPELGSFGAGDFDNLPATVPIGEAAARKVAEKLKRYSLPPEEYAALRRVQSVAQDPPNPPLGAIVVEGNRRVNSEVILASMETEVGQPLDQNTVDLDMRRIYGRGDFESVRPDVRIIKGGEETLVVKVTEKPWGPNYARFGLELEADLGKQARFNLLGSFRSTWLNRLGGEWRNDLVLGSSIIADSRFYQPLDERQYFFVEPRIAYANLPFDLYLDSQRVAEYRDQAWGGGIDFGINFAEYGEARVGLIAGRRSFSIESGSPILPAREGLSVGTARALLTIDQLDSVSFTRSGYLLAIEGRASRKELGATDNYDRIEAEGRTAFSFGRHALQFALRGGGSIGDDPLPSYAQFQLGGFLNMSGYAQGQLIGPRFTYGRIGYLAKLLQIPFLEGMYSGVALEALRMPQLIAVNNEKLFTSATIYGAVDTPLGVLYLGYGYADAQNSSIYLYLGKPF